MKKQSKALATRTQLAQTENDLLKEVALDIGKEVCAYIEVIFPKAVAAENKSFLLSVRNEIHNQIVSAVRDEHWVGEIEEGTLQRAKTPEEWLQWRRTWRRRWLAQIRKNRRYSATSEGAFRETRQE